MQKETPPQHPIYKYVDCEKEADAVAYTFTDQERMMKYPFKFPELKPDEARVEVLYTGLCHTDCSFVKEHYFSVEQWPFTPGHEVMGIVTAVGSGVTSVKVGDRVGYGGMRQTCEKCEFCLKGQENLCQGKLEQKFPFGKYWGGFATAIQHPAQWLFKIPERIPDDKAAPLLCAGATCYYPISRYAKKGDNVAILGMGGLGHMGVKIAKAWGCNVTAFTSNQDKEDLAAAMGADRVVVITDESLKQEQGKYHVVLNTITIAYDNFDALLGITRPAGYFCQIGLPAKENLCSFWPKTLISGEINLVGSLFSTRQAVRDMLEFVAEHNILPVCEDYSFDEFPKAYQKLYDANPIFRCVVNCKDYHRKHVAS